MTIEPVGLLALVVGLGCLYHGEGFGVFALLIASLLGASAALFLPSLNGANVQPAHLLLGFLMIELVRRRSSVQAALGGLAFPHAGFWLLLTVIYGGVASIVMPRLFAGATYVFNIAQGDGGVDILLVPLGPVSANITQSVYFLGDLLCFVIFNAFASRAGWGDTVAKAVLTCAFVNLGFAALDLITHATGTGEVMSVVRNASYRMLDDVQLGGYKRIVGSFAEASAFAYATLGLFAFVGELWLQGLYRRSAGLAWLLSLVALVFATSSTGYFGAGCILLLQYLRAFHLVVGNRSNQNAGIFVCVAPLVAAILAMGVWMQPQAQATIQQIADITVFSKLDSQSGIERTAWNAQAMQAFRDTGGAGVGIGSVRASSWPVAVVSNLGIVGTATLALFIVGMFFGGARDAEQREAAVRAAARAACLGQIIASSVGASFVDLGLYFFAMAGVACGMANGGARAVTPWVPPRHRALAPSLASRLAAAGHIGEST